MKIERNAPCSCGSGIKYKKCCGTKPEVQEQRLEMSAESLLSTLAFTLENAHLLTQSANAINLKSVRFENGGDTILVEFYAQHSRSNDIKGEIAYIMSSLSNFLQNDAYNVFGIKIFAAKALDDSENEIMYAVNDRSAAAAIINGNPLEWYKTTIFQENTADYRLSRAKTMISDIENGIRTAIRCVYELKFGAGWWDLAIEPKLSASIKRTYENQFDAQIDDGGILVNYTFTLELKKIISADWGSFRHLFDRKTAFEDIMVELNAIRREEAHNREISSVHLNDLERIYDALLGEIAGLYPEVTTNYLVENWKTKIREAMVNPATCAYTEQEFNTQDLLGKRNLIIKDCTGQINYIRGAVVKLRSLKPPAAKRKKHEEMVALLEKMQELQQLKLEQTVSLEFNDYKQLIEDINSHIAKMDLFSKEFLISES